MDKDIELLRKFFKDKERDKSFKISDDEFTRIKDYLKVLSDLDLCQINIAWDNPNDEKLFCWEIYCCQNGNIIINDIDKIFNGPLPVIFYLRRR